MPSAHSQFVFFFAVLIFLMYFRWGRLSKLLELSFTLFLWIAAILVAWGRVYFNYHTSKQVLAGSAVGVILALLWYFLYIYFIDSLFEKLEDTSICRYFSISHSEKLRNNALFDYHNAISRKVRGKSLSTYQESLLGEKKKGK